MVHQHARGAQVDQQLNPVHQCAHDVVDYRTPRPPLHPRVPTAADVKVQRDARLFHCFPNRLVFDTVVRRVHDARQEERPHSQPRRPAHLLARPGYVDDRDQSCHGKPVPPAAEQFRRPVVIDPCHLTLEFSVGGTSHLQPERAGIDHLRPDPVYVLCIEPVSHVPPLQPTLFPQLVLLRLLVRPHGHFLRPHPVLDHQPLPIPHLDMRGLVPEVHRQSLLPKFQGLIHV